MLGRFIAGPGEGVDLALLIARYLGDDMCGGAEAIDAQAFAVAGFDQAAIADQPGAKQRRGFGVAIDIGDGQAEALVGDGVLGVTAVDGVAGKLGIVAEIFLAILAIRTSAAGPAQPGDADAVADFKLNDAIAPLRHFADDLMAEDERQFGLRQFAVDNVQIGAADGAGVDADQELARAGAWCGDCGVA